MPGPFAPERLYKGALTILTTLREAGHEAYIAGGAVRDHLLNRQQNDLDLATSATPDQIRPLFKRTFSIGESFGVILVRMQGRDYEVATFREDQDYRDGRRPASVRFSTAREDVLRRDFTINGMLWDAEQERVLDWVGGEEDIRLRRVRTIGRPEERFAEDRLRMLRALRFAAQLDFEIEEQTWEAICRQADRLEEVSTERMRDELQKILLAPCARRGLAQLRESGLESALKQRFLKNYNELCKATSRRDRLNGSLQGLFPESGVAEELDGWLLINCSLLCGMPPENGGTIKLDGWRGLLHGVDKKLFCSELYRLSQAQKQSNDACRVLSETAELWFDLQGLKGCRLADQLRLLRSRECHRLRRLLPILCGEEAVELEQWLHELETRHGSALHPRPWLNGHDLIALGAPRGPVLKTLLRELESEQLEGRLASRQEAESFARARL